MRKQKKAVSVTAISMAFVLTMMFLPRFAHAFYFPPSPEYQIDTIIHEVEDLVGKGVLSEKQGSELNTIVGEAQKVILKEQDTRMLCILLQDFINQVQAYISAGTLAATKGQMLIGSANELISQLR